MKKFLARVLEVAGNEVGVREQGGSNQGPRVDQYLAAVGLDSGYPWCAAFVYWGIQEAVGRAGGRNPFLRSAYCPAIDAWARDKDILVDHPKPGDVFLLYSSSSRLAIHTGFVTAVAGSTFETIEGNTNIDGSSEGVGVFSRNRPINGRYRFVRWARLVTDSPAPTFALLIDETFLCNMPIRNHRALCPVTIWGEHFGFEVSWDKEHQVVLFDGQELEAQVTLIGDRAYAPVAELAKLSGLMLELDQRERKIVIHGDPRESDERRATETQGAVGVSTLPAHWSPADTMESALAQGSITAQLSPAQAILCDAWPETKKVLEILVEVAAAAPNLPPYVEPSLKIAMLAGDAASKAFCPDEGDEKE